MKRFSMTSRLERVLVAHARDCFISQSHLTENWQKYRFAYEPDFEKACGESDAFISLLSEFGAQVDILPPTFCTGLDSLYVHDPVATTANGFLTTSMGKELRQDEPSAVGIHLKESGFEVSSLSSPSARLEGGDIVWLRPDLVAVGEGFRSNREGIEALREHCGNSVSEIVSVPLPYWNGPSDVLHLMSFISPLSDRDLLVYSRLMPVIFRQRLLDYGFNLIELPAQDYDTIGCNVLALDESTCLIESRNVATIDLLKDRGFDVRTYSGQHISLAGEGGPTCLTRPLMRS